MLSLKLAACAALAATLTLAAPVSTTATSISTSTSTEDINVKPFSFSKWVDDILNPNVVALTPEQALEAYYESINDTTISSPELAKRAGATCETDNSKRVPVSDAVWLVNTLAAGGQSPVQVPIPFISKAVLYSPSKRSSVIGQKNGNLWVTEPSEYWARAGGLIMGESSFPFLLSFFLFVFFLLPSP